MFGAEIDGHARATYAANFGAPPAIADIDDVAGADVSDATLDRLVPDHDILAAGFPCPAFSIAGLTRRNSLGRPNGFDCPDSGGLVFRVIRITAVKRPMVVLLENVRHLVHHDGGRTLAKITGAFRDLGYAVSHKVVNSQTVVPQARQRVFIVALRDGGEFTWPDFEGDPVPLRAALDDDVDAKYTLTERAWAGHVRRAALDVERCRGFTVKLADPDRPAATLTARYYRDGREVLVPQEGKLPRRLTPREAARVQGFPEHFRLHPSGPAAYRQLGNAVPPPVVARIAAKIAADHL